MSLTDYGDDFCISKVEQAQGQISDRAVAEGKNDELVHPLDKSLTPELLRAEPSWEGLDIKEREDELAHSPEESCCRLEFSPQRISPVENKVDSLTYPLQQSCYMLSPKGFMLTGSLTCKSS